MPIVWALFVLYYARMARKTRVNLQLGPRHMKELEWLMERWGLDMTNALRVIISNAVREERLKDESANNKHQQQQ